ncbi:hypothetical protein ACLBWP_01740 [Microbacterium sp. M1A1_1b]
MTTLTMRDRDRRGRRIFAGVLAVIAAAATIELHRNTVTTHPSEFWVPTIAGLAFGALLRPVSQRLSRLWLNLAWAGYLGVFLALVYTRTFSPFAWMLAVSVGALLAEAFVPRTKAAGVTKRPIADVEPWTGSGVTATAGVRPSGRGTTRTAVTIDTRDGSTAFLVSDLAAFFDGQVGTAESANDEPLTFLTRKGIAAKSSIVDDASPGLTAGTLFLHSAVNDSRPSAVFTAEDAKAFEHWVRTIPED